MSSIFSLVQKLGATALDPNDTESERLSKTLLMFASALMGFAAVLWLTIYWTLGLKLPASVPVAYQLISSVSLIIFLKNRDFRLFRATQLGLFLFFPFMVQWSIGSFISSSGVSLWALMAPIGAMVTMGPRHSIPWFVAYGFFTVLSGVFDYYLADQEPRLPADTIAVFFVLNFLAISSMIYLLVSFFVREKDRMQEVLDEKHRELEAEQEKSERLLLNILPEPIAERLKKDDSTIADGFADVTVMFSDIVDFTRLTEEMPPARVVAMLDAIFSRFDALAEKHGIEKIKTIGDAYMVAGGLDRGQEDYAAAVAEMALDMLEAVAEYRREHNNDVDVHIGIGTGPVVAGVIGRKRFIYDVWGDTVNIASRMTSEAHGGYVAVDATTWRRLKGRYRFEGPREVQVKGKGMMQVYMLAGRAEKGGQ